MLKQHVFNSCRFLLKPLVRFLIRHGVTWDEFSELSKDAYVHVAREEHGIQGRPTNNSRVAMLTGLSRREVARVRDRLIDNDGLDDVLHGNRLSRVLSGWHTDPDFLDESGDPRVLAADGGAGSIDSLLSRYAGDLPHSAVRKELLQRSLIEELNDGRIRVLERDFVIPSLDPAMVQQMGLALHDHAKTLDYNLNEEHGEERRFEGMADNINMSPESAEKFRELIATRGLSFLEDVDSWLSDNEVTEDTPKNKVRLGVGVYLIYDESEQGLVK